MAPLLLIGVGLGPHGLSVLSPGALAAVDPAVPVALAVLGILVGLGAAERRMRVRLLHRSGFLLALLTTTAIALGLVPTLQPELTSVVAPWLFPVMCAVCGASSLTLPGRPLTEPRRATDALVETEVTMSIVAGAILLAFVREGTAPATGLMLARVLGVVGVMAIAGWLLVRHTTSITERRVFAIATLLLVGGAADFLSSSALLGGLVAGAVWQRLGGRSREALQAEILYAQHPFVVLVLLVAGARTEVSWLTAGLAAAYVSLRAAVRFLAGRLVQRLVPSASSDLHLQLVAPGVFGVAYALSVGRVVGLEVAGVGPALSTVVIGTLLSDLTARLVASRGGQP